MSTLKTTNIQHASAASAAITLDANGQATLNGLAYPTSGSLSGRNRIINGNFDIWQRGTATGTWVAPISNYYFPDRWVFNSTGTGGNGAVSQQAFTAGQTDVPGEPTFFMRWQITSAASGQTTGNCYVEQRIEDVRTLAGQTATISFYAKGTGTLPGIYLTQTFGSGGSAQVVYTLATNVALNANWTKYTYTVNVGSISGKTIGTNHYVGLTFMVPINTTYTFDLAQVQVEQGSVATPFERRSYGQELSLCQRYYQARTGMTIQTYASTSFYAAQDIGFAVPMRVAPNVILTNGTSNNLTATSVTTPSASGFGFVLAPTVTGMCAVGSGQNAGYTASAEL